MEILLRCEERKITYCSEEESLKADLTVRSLTRGLISLFFSLLNMKFAQQVCVPVQIPPAVRFLRQKYAGLAVGIGARRALTTERIKVKFQIARGLAGLCSVFNISLLAYPLG